MNLTCRKYKSTKSQKTTIVKELVFFFLVVILISCGKKKEVEEGILLKYGDKVLTQEEVISLIPQGINAQDSAALFKAIIDGWVKNVVLSDFAEERLYDTQAIDRRVNEYRNSLIVQEYLTRFKESKTPKIDENQVREYYEHYQKDLKLEVPLIKGIFLKINSNASGKDEIKRLLESNDINKIDKLEQDWIDRALEYNYFRDNWVDWETVAGMIPYRFGDPDKFLEENKYFETEYGDCSYYLQISDYLPSGEQQPYEFAKKWITTQLTQGELAEYERVLVNSLLDKSVKDKKLEMIGYDPIKHELIKNHVKEDNE